MIELKAAEDVLKESSEIWQSIHLATKQLPQLLHLANKAKSKGIRNIANTGGGQKVENPVVP